MMAEGASLALSVVGGPEGELVILGGAKTALTGVAEITAGKIVMANSAANSSAGYERGGTKEDGQMGSSEKSHTNQIGKDIKTGRLRNQSKVLIMVWNSIMNSLMFILMMALH